MKIAMLVFMILVIGGLYIISENNLALNTRDNVNTFGSMYGYWIKSNFQDAIKITGKAVEMEWLPDKQESQIQKVFFD